MHRRCPVRLAGLQPSDWGRPPRTCASATSTSGRRAWPWDDLAGLGLLHMGARHYSPALGRFLQPDPSAAEANLYAYAANSPVSRSDPSGLDTYFGHTRKELEFCNPVNFWSAGACAKNITIGLLASREAQRLFPNSAPRGKQDAMRHCIWQGCLVVAVGFSMAAKLGDLHKDFAGNPWRDRLMDEWNNRVGRVLGSGLADKRGYGNQVRDRCLFALKIGVLFRWAN